MCRTFFSLDLAACKLSAVTNVSTLCLVSAVSRCVRQAGHNELHNPKHAHV